MISVLFSTPSVLDNSSKTLLHTYLFNFIFFINNLIFYRWLMKQAEEEGVSGVTFDAAAVPS